MNNLTTQGVFRYSSIIIHLILFQQGNLCPIQLNRQYERGLIQLVIHWTELVRAGSLNFTFSYFIDSFIHPVLQLLYSHEEPKIGEEIKNTLHLSEQTKTGDWYLYQNYIEIRI